MGEMGTVVLIDCNPGCTTPQRGIITYGLSANRQRPFAGALNAAIFNTWRRFRHQILYVAPPFLIAYATMNWAIEKYELLPISGWPIRQTLTSLILGTSTSTRSLAVPLRVRSKVSQNCVSIYMCFQEAMCWLVERS
jgi:ubiquinol-cytochrome c reductase subunit 8